MKLTKPKPRDSLVCGSRMIWHFSTFPYLEKRRVTSSSLSLGWMPVTKRLEPVLLAPSPSLEPLSSFMWTLRSPPGEAERRRVLSWPLSLRGEALRLSRS